MPKGNGGQRSQRVPGCLWAAMHRGLGTARTWRSPRAQGLSKNRDAGGWTGPVFIQMAACIWFLSVTLSWAHTRWDSAGSPPSLASQRVSHFLPGVLNPGLVSAKHFSSCIRGADVCISPTTHTLWLLRDRPTPPSSLGSLGFVTANSRSLWVLNS